MLCQKTDQVQHSVSEFWQLRIGHLPENMSFLRNHESLIQSRNGHVIWFFTLEDIWKHGHRSVTTFPQAVIHDNSSMADASVGKVRWFEHVLTFSGYLVGYDSCIQFPPAFMLVRCSVRLGHRIDSTKMTLKPRRNREQRNIIDIQR